jgi:rhodanese-related sulfurtransferase
VTAPRRTALQILGFLAAAIVAGLVSNAVRGTLEWGYDDPLVVKNRLDDISIEEAGKAHEQTGTIFLDVRSAADYAASHIAGAAPFSSDDFDAAWAEMRDFMGSDVTVIVYGEDVLPVVRAAQYLASRQVQARILEHGFAAWRARGLPVEGGS